MILNPANSGRLDLIIHLLPGGIALRVFIIVVCIFRASVLRLVSGLVLWKIISPFRLRVVVSLTNNVIWILWADANKQLATVLLIKENVVILEEDVTNVNLLVAIDDVLPDGQVAGAGAGSKVLTRDHEVSLRHEVCFAFLTIVDGHPEVEA